jgi:hypothetical protein
MSQSKHTHASIKASSGDAKAKATALAELRGAGPDNPLAYDEALKDAQLIGDQNGVTWQDALQSGVAMGFVTPQEQPA